MKRNKSIFVSLCTMFMLIGLVGLGSAHEPQYPSGGYPSQVSGNTSVSTPLGNGITFQGKLNEADDPANGPFDFQFTLYDAASGGSQVGDTLTLNDVSVINGLFTVQLNFDTSAFQGEARWLEIAVRPGESTARYTLLSPRQMITAVPYALSLQPGAAVNGTSGTVILSLSGGAVGLDSSGSLYGVYGHSNNEVGRGVVGVVSAINGGNVGVYGQSDSGSGYGVYGWASAGSGDGIGVYGESKNHVGVYGVSISDHGRGVIGRVPSPTGDTVGVVGYSDSNEGTGTFGYGALYGVCGTSNSNYGRGVVGYVNSETGETVGVYGHSSSVDGRGVLGYAAAQDGYTYGVFGQSVSTDGIGVLGYASATSGWNIGVYGVTDSQDYGYGGLFWGRTSVTGDFSASGNKSFKIDHPLDPANRYLYHFTQESPEVQNVYNGVVTLDGDGLAVVFLPDYFSSLNKAPFRYQLTPIGAPMPNLYIAEEIQENSFTIAGGAPFQKVSWEVTAVRNDPYLRDHPVMTEQEKPEGEQGTYIYPEGYGQPAEKGLDYELRATLLKQTPDVTLPGMSEIK